MMTCTHTPVLVRHTSQGIGEWRTDCSFLRVISEVESFSIWNRQHHWHLFVTTFCTFNIKEKSKLYSQFCCS
jgi:hypothetical protein